MDRSLFTIAAPITPKGIGAIAGIRISGLDALEIILSIISLPKEKLQPGKLLFTYFLQGGVPVDEITVCYRKAPHSFTGEDTVEIFCHGGWMMLNIIMDQLLEKGAVYALPGEFSKRAMENGKFDLIKLEGIQQIVQARTKQEALLAGSNIFGNFQTRIQSISEKIIEVKSFIEAQISFPMDMENEIFPLSEKLIHIQEDLRCLLQQASQSDQFRKGYQTLIIGKPNVGKSSLFNALLGWDRMLVSPYPSTTHDYVMELIDLHGFPVYLVDSAGYVEDGKEIDALFNETLPGKVQQSFLSLFVLDAFSYQSKDLELIRQYPNARKIIVINKVDLTKEIPVNAISKDFPEIPILVVSTVTKEGLYDLMEEVYNQIKLANPEKLDYYLNERHYFALKKCCENFENVLKNVREGYYQDMIASDIERAGQWLEELLGYRLQDAAYQKIFDTFCIGK
ncbi:MAG: tRNA uridine-5-carboxymethylaminomethyl(34) synthesis GTPase MnmE [Caldisericia bacterium]|nr:tRNA uridine-5-carboxymethylaminomethyl(34) synthesis GTPase MnmE [Caldisericia bacterium]